VKAAHLVARLTRQSRSNFYYAFLTLPRARREALYAVYAFCRTVDDIVDLRQEQGAEPSALRAELGRWRREVAACYEPAGRPEHPIAQRLAQAVRQYGIPRAALEAIVEGVEMDLDGVTYETAEDLYPYCYRVASAVGLAAIEIFGYTDLRAREYAVSLGIALQLTNILRDVGADARSGRIYLPQAELRTGGVTADDLRTGRHTPAFVAVMECQAARARQYYAAARAAFPAADARSLVAAEIMGRIYFALLQEIERRRFRVLDERITVPGWRKVAIALRCWTAGMIRRGADRPHQRGPDAPPDASPGPIARAEPALERRDSMRVAVYRGEGRLVAEQWPRPVIGPGEILLRVRGCGLCGSDIAKVLAVETAIPVVLGHEVVGDVVEVGPGVSTLAVGDRVVAAHHVPCGACHYCRRGSHSMCRGFKASHLDPGGFAEYVRVPGANVRDVTFRIPAHVSDEAASFVEPLGCCLRAVRRAAVQAGDTVAVVGLGSIGCLFVQVLERAGATVVGLDQSAERLQLARRFAVRAALPDEAETLIAELSAGRGADQVFVTGGATKVLPRAVRMVRDGGSIHYFAGGPGDELPLALETLYHRELTLSATYSSSPADLAEAFRAVTTAAVRVAGLYTHRLPLDRLGEGVELMRSQRALKVYVTP
jgi:squalene synthase HpnD